MMMAFLSLFLISNSVCNALTTVPPTQSPSNTASQVSNEGSESLKDRILSIQVPLVFLIGACLFIIICSCICCYWYKQRLIKKYRPTKHLQTRTESLSEPVPQRKGSNDSDFDVLPLTENLTIGGNKSQTDKVPNDSDKKSEMQKRKSSIVETANAMYGIKANDKTHTKAKEKQITDSPSLIVIQHKSVKNGKKANRLKATSYSLNSPPEQLLESPNQPSMDTAMLPTYDSVRVYCTPQPLYTGT